MKERPILFKGEMVRAILKRPVIRLPREVRGDGPFQATRAPAGEYTPLVIPHGAVSVQTISGSMLGIKPGEYDWVTRPKTQTRRVVNRLRGYGKIDGLTENVATGFNVSKENRRFRVSSAELLSLCPYGQPGDILWVRETWNALYSQAGDIPWYHHELGREGAALCIQRGDTPTYIYAADPNDPNYPTQDDIEAGFRWQPSILMPRWACRLRLRIKNVSLERLHDLTDDDAHAEGISEPQFRTSVKVGGVGHDEHIPLSYRGAFANLWEQINGKRGYGWGENPWVWAIEFERVDA